LRQPETIKKSETIKTQINHEKGIILGNFGRCTYRGSLHFRFLLKRKQRKQKDSAENKER
jgi:hypothetical protein